MPHVYRPIKRTPEEAARLKAVREYFSREKPSFEDVVATSPHARLTTLGDCLAARVAGRGPGPGDDV